MASPFWMRWLDFRRLRDLFSIVLDNDGALRAKDLNERAIKAGVLVSEGGATIQTNHAISLPAHISETRAC